MQSTSNCIELWVVSLTRIFLRKNSCKLSISFDLYCCCFFCARKCLICQFCRNGTKSLLVILSFRLLFGSILINFCISHLNSYELMLSLPNFPRNKCIISLFANFHDIKVSSLLLAVIWGKNTSFGLLWFWLDCEHCRYFTVRPLWRGGTCCTLMSSGRVH